MISKEKIKQMTETLERFVGYSVGSLNDYWKLCPGFSAQVEVLQDRAEDSIRFRTRFNLPNDRYFTIESFISVEEYNSYRNQKSFVKSLESVALYHQDNIAIYGRTFVKNQGACRFEKGTLVTHRRREAKSVGVVVRGDDDHALGNVSDVYWTRARFCGNEIQKAIPNYSLREVKD